MQQESKTIAARYDTMFGRGWRKIMAEQLGVKAGTVSDGRKGPTLAALGALIEFFEQTPPKRWPKRWLKLKSLADGISAKDGS